MWMLLLACGPRSLDHATDYTDIERLIAAGDLQGRQTLALRDLGLGAELARVIVESPDAQGLLELDLSGNLLGPPGATLLAEAETLSNLQVLDLGQGRLYPDGNRVRDDGAADLLNSTTLTSLHTLDLSKNSLTADVGAVVTGSTGLPALTTLILDSNALYDAGAIGLGAPTERRLTRLDAGWNGIGDPGAQALTTAPLLQHTTVLLLSSNEISQGNLAGSWSPLEALYLSGNPLTPEATDQLQGRFGDALKLDGGVGQLTGE